MHSFLVWLEQGCFATWVREGDSIMGYPTILFLHTVGMGMLAGTAAIIDLRVLGFAPELPLAPMDRFFPAMWAGFWINLLTGTALLIADATTKFVSPVFRVKMAFVALGVVTVLLLRRRVFRNPSIDRMPTPRYGKVLAGLSLICWIGAVTAGRLMAYLGPVSGLPIQ